MGFPASCFPSLITLHSKNKVFNLKIESLTQKENPFFTEQNPQHLSASPWSALQTIVQQISISFEVKNYSDNDFWQQFWIVSSIISLHWPKIEKRSFLCDSNMETTNDSLSQIRSDSDTAWFAYGMTLIRRLWYCDYDTATRIRRLTTTRRLRYGHTH